VQLEAEQDGRRREDDGEDDAHHVPGQGTRSTGWIPSRKQDKQIL
jgi:hypothetical protein